MPKARLGTSGEKAPDRRLASAAPTSTAIRVLGQRTSQTTLASSSRQVCSTARNLEAMMRTASQGSIA